MYLACDEIDPGRGCDFVARGEDADAVAVAMLAHTREAHAELHDERTTSEIEAENVDMEAYIRSLL